MSYCRFSSNNFRSDVYVYADVYGGYTTHVAGNRHAFPPFPQLPLHWLPDLGQRVDMTTRTVVYPNRWKKIIGTVLFGVFAWSHRLQMWSLGVIPRRRITLPHAGEQFNDATPGECAARLTELRVLGYHVPRYAVETLLAEQNDHENNLHQ